MELLKVIPIKSKDTVLAIFKGAKLYPPCIWKCQPTLEPNSGHELEVANVFLTF